jgi:hypothetical protein
MKATVGRFYLPAWEYWRHKHVLLRSAPTQVRKNSQTCVIRKEMLYLLGGLVLRRSSIYLCVLGVLSRVPEQLSRLRLTL